MRIARLPFDHLFAADNPSKRSRSETHRRADALGLDATRAQLNYETEPAPRQEPQEAGKAGRGYQYEPPASANGKLRTRFDSRARQLSAEDTGNRVSIEDVLSNGNPPLQAHVVAPDGSRIYEGPRSASGSVSRCELPPNVVSKPVRHQTITETWRVLQGGAGRMWLQEGGRGPGEHFDLVPGAHIRFSPGTSFQFRTVGDKPLRLAILAEPRWPGDHEAPPCAGEWAVPVAIDREAAVAELKRDYPEANIVCMPPDAPREIVCETEPGADKSRAIAIIAANAAHHHNRITETYKVLSGNIRLSVDGTTRVLGAGDAVTIKPGQSHQAACIGAPAKVLVTSVPGWTPDDHHLEP